MLESMDMVKNTERPFPWVSGNCVLGHGSRWHRNFSGPVLRPSSYLLAPVKRL